MALAQAGSLVPSSAANASALHEPGYMFRCDCRFSVEESDADFDSLACGCQREVCSCHRTCDCDAA